VLRGNLFAQPAMVLDSLAGAEVVQLEQLPDLDFAILVMGVGAALDPLDRFSKATYIARSSSLLPVPWSPRMSY
jgi:hypothetical protein